ncbi:hypothetical protein ACFSJQ_12395 [Vibrio olivae]
MTISKCRYLSAVSGAVLLTTPYAYADTDSSNTTETVVVTAAGYEQNIARAPATISVITAEDIEKKSYTDITDVLKKYFRGPSFGWGCRTGDHDSRHVIELYSVFD